VQLKRHFEIGTLSEEANSENIPFANIVLLTYTWDTYLHSRLLPYLLACEIWEFLSANTAWETRKQSAIWVIFLEHPEHQMKQITSVALVKSACEVSWPVW